MTGSGGDTGIDGVAVIANGILITDLDAFKELAEKASYLEVSFIFIQAERSAGFEAKTIGNFGFGVRDFFSESPKLPRNESIARAAEIMTAIFNASSKFRGNPSCRLYYVTTGAWAGDARGCQMKLKASQNEFEEFDKVMDGLLSVPYSELQKKLEEEKREKEKGKGRRAASPPDSASRPTVRQQRRREK